jgi:chaperone LolA
MQRMRASKLSLLLVTALACGDDPQAVPSPSGSALAPAQTAPVSASATAVPAPTQLPTASATAEPTPPTSGSAPPTASATTTASAVVVKPTSTATASAAPTVDPVPTTPPPQLGAPVSGSADEVAFNIDKVFKDAPRWKASFIQKHKQKITGTEREQKGTVYVERPNKISFRYDPPNKNRIVSDGTTLKLYVAEDQQMFENPVKKTEYPGAFGFIMGSGIRPSFEFSYNDKAKFDLGPILIGKPRTPNPQYEQVLFYVDKDKLAKGDPGAVNGVLILDAQGNRNRFELHSASFPTSIDAAEFTFTPPAGTNITK